MEGVKCLICEDVFATDILNHIRVMHPDALDTVAKDAMAQLRPVTQKMNDDDWVCDACDKQFAFGQLFGERFEGMVGDQPIVSLICAVCYMSLIYGV